MIQMSQGTMNPSLGTATGNTRSFVPHSLDGVPVIFDEKMRFIADSRGIFWFKRIYYGPHLYEFSPVQQYALLVHELGHCKLRHLEQRIAKLYLVLFDRQRLIELCHKQEFEADDFARRRGLGPDLAAALLHTANDGHLKWPLHPVREDRIARLLH